MLALLIVAGCSTPDRSSRQVWSDRGTARRVGRALSDAQTYKYPDVKVSAYEGNVQLSGFAETDEQRAEAARIASGVKGVRQVINEIMIKPSPVGRPTVRDPLGHETGRMLLDTNAPPRSTNPSDQNQENPSSGTEGEP